MMTADRILETALHHFARNGYDGASLADISAEVGIKKQSIYNHYRGKDELFLAVFRNAAGKELQIAADFVRQGDKEPLDKLLYRFLLEYKDRYGSVGDTKFFLRTSFFPPDHLRQEVLEASALAIDRIGALTEPLFGAAARSGLLAPEVLPEQASAAFAALLDGMFVELLYGSGERAMKRLEASWGIYWRGVRL